MAAANMVLEPGQSKVAQWFPEAYFTSPAFVVQISNVDDESDENAKPLEDLETQFIRASERHRYFTDQYSYYTVLQDTNSFHAINVLPTVAVRMSQTATKRQAHLSATMNRMQILYQQHTSPVVDPEGLQIVRSKPLIACWKLDTDNSIHLDQYLQEAKRYYYIQNDTHRKCHNAKIPIELTDYLMKTSTAFGADTKALSTFVVETQWGTSTSPRTLATSPETKAKGLFLIFKPGRCRLWLDIPSASPICIQDDTVVYLGSPDTKYVVRGVNPEGAHAFRIISVYVF